jgi:hypothetical protein
MKKRSVGFSMSLVAVLSFTFLLSQNMISVSSAVTVDDKAPIRNLTIPSLSPSSPEKAPVASIHASQSEMQTLGSVWEVVESGGWVATWTRRPGTNIFDAKWKHTNGMTAQDVITIQSWNKASGQIILKRESLNGTYTGIVDTQNRKINYGTATWYQTGDVWRAGY